MPGRKIAPAPSRSPAWARPAAPTPLLPSWSPPPCLPTPHPPPKGGVCQDERAGGGGDDSTGRGAGAVHFHGLVLGMALRSFLFTSLYSNSLNATMTVTTVLKGGLYSMVGPDVLRTVDGSGNQSLSIVGQLVQQ